MSLSAFFNSTIFWILLAVVIIGISIAIPFISMRLLRNAYGSGEIKNGVTAPAKIVRTWDTGTTINDSPLVGLELQVTPPNGSPFTAKCKKAVNRLQVVYFQPGQAVIVSYDPANPKKIHITDLGGHNVATTGTTEGRPVVGVPGMPEPATPSAIGLKLQEIDAANRVLMVTGQPAPATVTSYLDWNVHANRENPVVTLLLQVNPPGKPAFMAQAIGVIAAAAIPKFQPGCTIWVRYDSNDLTKVTIDHT